jgi:LysR family pca operon transcriptional activator
MVDNRIKFRHLQTFVEVARQKSVIKAAELLNVSQPAVTKTIRELEEVLGVSVVERDGRGIKLTRIGEIFLKHAGAALSALRQGYDSISQAMRDEAPPIRIGALPTVSTRIMPEAMKLFLTEGSPARIKIVTGENAVLMEQLRVGDLDLMVGRLAAPEKMTGFSFEHLYSEQVVLCVRPEHPLLVGGASVFHDLDKYPILMPTRASIIRPFVDSFLIANGVSGLQTQIETVSDAFGRAFTRETDAIWIISTGVVARDISDGLLVALPVDTSETRGPVGLTMRADASPSLPQLLLMQTIREVAGTLAQRP